MANVTLKKEAFDEYKLILPSKYAEIDLSLSRNKYPAIHWGVSAKNLWMHSQLACETLIDEGICLNCEYPKDDQKFIISSIKEGKEKAEFQYSQVLSTYIYDYVAPTLNFNEDRIVLDSEFPVILIIK